MDQPISHSDNVRSELARLQDRESTLTHLLNLEKERRVRAEQLAEVEHQACFELGHRLKQQKAVFSAGTLSQVNEVSSTVQWSQSKSTMLASYDGYSKVSGSGVCDMDTVECSIDFRDTANVASTEESSDVETTSPRMDEHKEETSIMSSNLSTFSESDFASSVFSQLPSDLQHMLGVGDTQEEEAKDSLSKAVAAVDTNDPDQLRQCILSSSNREGLRNHTGKSLLEMSCEKGQESCVRVLEEGGWDPNEVCSHGNKWTPLHICAKKGHLGSLKVLLELGVNPSPTDDNDQTPLFLSLRGGHETTAQLLMETCASLTIITKDGSTLLHAAAASNIPHTLRLLLTYLRTSLEGSKFKQIVNSPDNSGRTALHTAVSGGYRECVGVLCACEEVVCSQRDRWNRTPMDIANEECKKLIRNRESKQVIVYINSPDPSSHTNGHTKRLAIGQASVLSHHRLSDVEYLVEDVLREYCKHLQGLPLSRSLDNSPQCMNEIKSISADANKNSLSERVQAEFELSMAFKENADSSLKSKKDEYLQNCSKRFKNARSKMSPLDLNRLSIAMYQVGSFKWRPRELEKGTNLKTLFSVFGEAKLTQKETERQSKDQCEINITLKGPGDDCLDQLAFELMVPVARLQEYINLIDRHKALIVHGPRGSGKTQLAKGLANYIKARKGQERTQIVHASLHPSFQRDDLFRLLHLNGLLIQQNEGSEPSESQVIILDGLSLVHTPSVLAELLTSLEYRGIEHPMWVNDVYGRDGTLLYPCGHYYLNSSSYVIATKTSDGFGELAEPISVDQFAHVSLSLLSDSCSGVLVRHLMSKLIHSQGGVVPQSTLSVYRLVWWVFEVWVLYNSFVRRTGLLELAVGVRHFIQCPVESNDPETITSWLYSVWNHHLVPAIRSTLLATHKSQTHDDKTFDLLSKFPVACSELVFKPTCPLSYDGRQRMIDSLRVGLEGEETMGEMKGTQEKPQNKYTESQTPPASQAPSETTNSSTPPTEHAPNSAKPPLPPQPGSMVSYEDMVRNSPRNKAKTGKNRSNSTKSTKSMTLDNRVNKPPPAPAAAPEPVVLRPNARKNKTLRKLRSKTISLFSKDSGTSTLPRLFRKGSRASLASVSEDLTLSDNTHNHPAKEARQLEDMFDLLSAANSKRFEDQRSLSPPPKSNHGDLSSRKADLDNFLDMLSTASSKRIDEQRSPPPRAVPSPTRNKNQKKDKTVAKYTLPTGSPLREAYKEHPNRLLGIRGSSPPAYSSPDIIAAVESDRSRSQSLSHPVRRKYTNTSFSSYDSELLYSDDQSSISCREPVSYSAADIANDVHKQQNYSKLNSTSVETKQREHLDSFRGRAKTYDTSATSEPTRRRHPGRNLVISHPSSSKSTPGVPHTYNSPASPLTKTSYSSPRNSPTIEQSQEMSKFRQNDDYQSSYDETSGVRSDDLYPGIAASIKAKSAADILDVGQDELGTIDDFDLFRAASEGDLMQSSARESFLETQTSSENGSGGYNEASVQPVNYTHSTNAYNGKPSYAYQSSPENYEDGHSLETNVYLQKRRASDAVTSGYGSDNYYYSEAERKRSYSASQQPYKRSGSYGQSGYSTTGRRFSHCSDNSKKELRSPTNSLGQNRRRSSDASSVFGSNLLYSASLGFDSLSRLSSSRDHLTNLRPSLTEDLTEM